MHNVLRTKHTIQHNTIQYNTIQYNTLQYNTLQEKTVNYITLHTHRHPQTNNNHFLLAENRTERSQVKMKSEIMEAS